MKDRSRDGKSAVYNVHLLMKRIMRGGETERERVLSAPALFPDFGGTYWTSIEPVYERYTII